MLKITEIARRRGPRVVKLEGTLLEPWIAEARRACLSPAGTAPCGLDLSALTFADQPGAEFLRELLRGGVRIETCSPFVAELLHWKPNP